MKRVFYSVCLSVAALSLSGCIGFPLPKSSNLQVSHEYRPPRGLVAFCQAEASRCFGPEALETAPSAIPSGRPMVLSPARMLELAHVNAEINQRIAPRSDMEAFGKIDHWTDQTAEGDCDDYVMTKRAELLGRGWPQSALLIVLADTEQGERHVVLMAVTNRGDFILDNRFDEVVPWEDLPYHWIARQAPGDLLRWHRVKPTRRRNIDREAIRLARRFP